MQIISFLLSSIEVTMNLFMDEDTGVIKKGESVNPLQDIYSRLEEEKFSLTRQIKGELTGKE